MEDRSGQDWKMCCMYFETHADVDERQAFEALHGKFATKHDGQREQKKYGKLTIAMAMAKTRKEQGRKGSDAMESWRKGCKMAEEAKNPREIKNPGF